MYTDQQICSIFSQPLVIAMIGFSANPARPSHSVAAFLQEKGHRVIPVNPGLAGQTQLGEMVYASLAEIPIAVDMVDIFRTSEALPGLLAEALAKPVGIFWTQLNVYDAAVAARAQAAGLTVIMNRCPQIEYARLDL